MTYPETRLSIRRATCSDISRLLDLYQHLIPGDDQPEEPVAREVFERFLAYGGSAVFLGETGGVLVASCTLVVIPNLTRGASPYALIENVVTHGAYRRLGFGRALLDSAVEAAWLAGCYKVMLLTGAKDPSTLRFYSGAGFAQTKTGFQRRRIAERHES